MFIARGTLVSLRPQRGRTIYFRLSKPEHVTTTIYQIDMSTYSKIYIQVVIAVRGRSSVIASSWEEDLYKYVTGIITNKGQKLIAINGMPDHIHILIGLKPSCCLSDLVREIKKASNAFINEGGFTQTKFSWQEGFGAFSYSHSALDNVISYIQNQKEHHRKKTFKEEYIDFLKKYEIGYDERYLFHWIADEEE